MSDISREEYLLVSQAVVVSQQYVKNANKMNPQTKQDLESRISQAMLVAESVNKRLKEAEVATANNGNGKGKGVPLGGSFRGYELSKAQVQKSLFKMFRVDHRIV